MLKWIFSLIACALFLLIVVVCFRALHPSKPTFVDVPLAPVQVDREAALERFAGALRIQTVSEPLQPTNAAAMRQLCDYLQAKFVRLHQTMRREIVGDSLLFTWAGSDASLAPILFMGHMDVVPVEASTLGRWTYPPFDGIIADSFVWGRGSMDDKQTVLSLMEAATALIEQGFQPKRTVYFAFGEDEESDGHGAEALVALLKARGVHPAFVLDEGGQIARGTIPGVSGDVALISIAEKGIVSVQMRVSEPGGHSSRPPRQTAIGIMSRAVSRLEDQQMPMRLDGVTAQMMEALSSRMSFSRRVMIQNRWLFSPLLLSSLGASTDGNALIRTTTAVTMFNSGVKDNVLPAEATAVVNFRILPGDSVDSVMRHVRDVIRDERVKVTIYGNLSADPSPVSPIDTPSFSNLEQTVHEFFPAAVAVPNLLVARTDSARYYAITENVYKFFPAIRDHADVARVHGTNERLGTEDYLKSIQFMATLIRREAQE